MSDDSIEFTQNINHNNIVIVNVNNKIHNFLYFIKYIIIFLSISIIFSDFNILYEKNTCIYQQTSIDFTMKQYLVLSIYSYVILFIYMYIYVSCIMKTIQESTHIIIIFIYLIYKLYLLILLLIGFIIFYCMIDTYSCNTYIYNYITIMQIIRTISLFFIHVCI